MTSPNIFNQLLLWPIINLLIAFYKGFEFLHIPGPLGWAIIALTIAIRLILHPLTVSQLRSQKKMQELKPHLDRLSQKHKDDKKRLQQEQMRLYKDAGINPAAGCLPLLLQFPVLIALYNVFFRLLSSGNIHQIVMDINKILYFPGLRIQNLDLSFIGINLAAKPNQWQQYGVILLIIPPLTALLQWLQAKTMAPMTQAPKPVQKDKNDKDKKAGSDDFSSAMQMQMTYFMPLLIGYFSLSFPVGLSLYWNTFSLFGIIQQIQVNKKSLPSSLSSKLDKPV